MNLSPTREVTLDRETHTYFVDGVKFEGPSVTEILSFLGKSYENVRDKEYYQDRGTAGHLAVELYVKGTLDESTVVEEIAPRLATYKAFEKETGFKPLYCELPLVSFLHGYATCIDLAGMLDGVMALIDLKLATNVDPIVELQLGGQSIAFDEHHRSNTIQRRFYLKLREDGMFERDRDLKEVTTNPKLFLRAFHLFRDWKSKHVRKKK